MTNEIPPLDILIYAHDGRGLGHASRSIAIGMAVRRLYPERRVLFVSGCKVSQELIGEAPLDWLKLPSYETEVVGGKSRGITGNSMFTDSELGWLRSAQLRQMVELFRPSVVLCDHSPQGKHKELIAALEVSSAFSRWVLGVRGVVGGVAQVSSELARTLYDRHFSGLLWYGDSSVLGDDHLLSLRKMYGAEPQECGYVSRLLEHEMVSVTRSEQSGKQDLTVSIPWLGEHSRDFLRELAQGLAGVALSEGCTIFTEGWDRPEVQALFAKMPRCTLARPSGQPYIESLRRSRAALIYGGYNSIMDVLSYQIPAVVVMREMRDLEQQVHLAHLAGASCGLIRAVNETEVTGPEIQRLLAERLSLPDVPRHRIDLTGARRAATFLNAMLDEVGTDA